MYANCEYGHVTFEKFANVWSVQLRENNDSKKSRTFNFEGNIKISVRVLFVSFTWKEILYLPEKNIVAAFEK